MAVIIKSDQEIALMREAGKIVAEILAVLAASVRPGMETQELDVIARKELEKYKAQSSFLGYRGYPATVCVSVNEQVVHGIPGRRVVQEGDLVSIDFGAIYKGFQGDSALTVGVGKISPKAAELIETTWAALEAGIEAAKVGVHLGDVSWAIQSRVESNGFSVVREYVGHGIGRQMHEEPQVPNFGTAGTGLVLKRGMALALEPMVNVGGWQTVVAPDQWTVSTADGSLSAHFEHSIAITEDGAEVLTRP